MKDFDIKNTCQISNYFSDAIFGWSCRTPTEKIVVGFERFKNDVLFDRTIPMRVRDEIVNDLTSVYSKCNDKLTDYHNYSTLTF